jgi:hypothetical protein
MEIESNTFSYSTLVTTAPIGMWDALSALPSYSTLQRLSEDIYLKLFSPEKVAEHDLTIFFHVFSMNGSSLFTALWDLLDSKANGKAVKDKVRGIVFDRYELCT